VLHMSKRSFTTEEKKKRSFAVREVFTNP
jgi:hypothetical protein